MLKRLTALFLLISMTLFCLSACGEEKHTAESTSSTIQSGEEVQTQTQTQDSDEKETNNEEISVAASSQQPTNTTTSSQPDEQTPQAVVTPAPPTLSSKPTSCAHSYTKTVIAPTCMKGGYTINSCRLCGYSFNSDLTKAKGHAYKTTTVAPTVLTGGYDEHTCTLCGDTYKDNETSPINPNYESQGFVFKSNGDGTCEITGIGSCTDTVVSIPKKSPAGDTVTAVSGRTFMENKNIQVVSFPDTVTELKGSMFYSCRNLKKVVMPKNCTEISNLFFAFCGSLQSVDFNGCRIDKIPDNAFSSSGITSLDLPDSVTEIGNLAFTGCSKLVSVTYGSSLTKIGSRSFDGCVLLSQCKRRDSNINLQGVTYLGDSAFRSTALTEYTASKNITQIGREAFKSSKLATLDLSKTSLTGIYAGVFASTPLVRVSLPDSLTTIGDGAFDSTTKLTNLTLPENVQKIGSKAFCYSAISTLRLGNKLTTIASEAFAGFSGRIVWGDNPTIHTIGYKAFYGYRGTVLTIPDSVTTIAYGALENCTNLTTLQIPCVGQDRNSGVSSTDCFGSIFTEIDCWKQETVIPASLKTVIIHGEKSLSTRDFMNVKLKGLVLGTQVTSIGYAFESGSVQNVYYEGNAQQWNSIPKNDKVLAKATVWYYSPSRPSNSGNFWHYDNNGNVSCW